MSGLLAPPPRRLEGADGAAELGSAAILRPDGDPGYEAAAARLTECLAAAGIPARRAEPGTGEHVGETPIRLHLAPAREAADGAGGQAYRLEVSPGGITVEGSAPAGLYYGVETALGWLAAHPPPAPDVPARLPAVRIEDRPGFRHRGLLLDVSRNRVPTLASLLRLVDTMAALKLNQLQLYTEHTFAYRGHEEVWRDASPLTADDVRALDQHCRRRFVELVPNQNSFGHLHRWLVHEPYRRLAEVPEGLSHPFADEPEPFSLCPVDPGSLELLADLYDQLLPHFTSRLFNVGFDETLDLGKGRSAEACRARGDGRVYLEFLGRVRELAAGHGRRIQVWGDILASRPELIREVPGDVVVLDWGYEAGHPFGERAAALAAAGLELYVCPGTSSWNSFAGRHDNALANLAEAALAGAEHGATGYLITDWGDFGHLQPPPVSWPSLVAGAAFGWNPEAAREPSALPLASLVDRYGEAGLAAGTGEALLALAGAYRAAGVTPMNASALFKLVVFAERALDDAGLRELTAADLERAAAAVARATESVSRLETATPASALARRELEWVAGMLRFACRLGSARLSAGGRDSPADLPAGERRRLAAELGRRIEELSALWTARSRPGGLRDSVERLARVRRLLS